MILTLEITGSDTHEPRGPAKRTFLEDGGTIGRAPNARSGNHWVLQHESVSRLHAEIAYVDGAFYITDPGSSNGIFLNGGETRLEIGRRYVVRSGDSIYIQPFTMRAVISGERNDYPSDNSRATGRAGMLTELLDRMPVREERVPRASELPDVSPFTDRVPTPRPIPPPVSEPNPGPAIPPGYIPGDSLHVRPSSDLVRPEAEFSESQPWPTPPSYPINDSRRPTPPHPADRGNAARAADSDTGAHQRSSEPLTASDAFAAMFAGAGMENVRASAELARDIGAIFRIVVKGVLDVLKARQQTKAEFDLEQTQFRPEQNNPLKFSVNVDDALHNLFVKRNPAYLGPVEAFDDAFRDLRNHQLATLAGVRAAFDAMLAEFSPERLEQWFERRSTGGMVSLRGGKSRYWELYRERYADMVNDRDDAFDHLFGEQFARAYEAQLEQLKAAGRGGKV